MQFDAEQIEALETAETVEALSEKLGPKMTESVLDAYMAAHPSDPGSDR